MTNQTNNTQFQVTPEQIQAFLAAQQATQASGTPLSNEQFMNVVNGIIQQGAPQPANAQPTPPQAQRFEYTEITDLHLPHLNAAGKAQMIAMANEIEKLKVSMYERVNQGIVISDIEMDNYNRMLKTFKKEAKVSFFVACADGAKRGGVKFVDVVDGVAQAIEVKANRFTDDVAGLTCTTIEDVSVLGIETLKFGSTFAQGTVTLGANVTKGLVKAGLGLFKR